MNSDMRFAVGPRFCGPARVANGGWFAGQVATRVIAATAAVTDGAGAHAASAGGAGAEEVTSPVTVTLRTPPPLNETLVVEAAGAGWRTRRAQLAALSVATEPVEPAVAVELAEVPAVTVVQAEAPAVAEATLADAVPPELPAVTVAQAEAAARAYPGYLHHPFPSCFVCGVQRPPGDGLGLRPGPLAGDPSRTASIWIPTTGLAGPDGAVPVPAVWAALDCPGGWAAIIATSASMVLGRITAVVYRTPAVGEACVVTGRLDRRDGRKGLVTTTVRGSAGDVVASATAVWFEVDPRGYKGDAPAVAIG